MTTFLVIIAVIIGGMILFSLFDKGAKERMEKSGEILEKNWATKRANQIINEVMIESVNEDGMDGLVEVIQMTYLLHQAKVEVSRSGRELIINMLEPNLVDQYYQVFLVLENQDTHSEVDVKIAKNFIDTLKAAGIKGIQQQTLKEKKLFLKAGVNKYTSQIDGNLIYSVDYY